MGAGDTDTISEQPASIHRSHLGTWPGRPAPLLGQSHPSAGPDQVSEAQGQSPWLQHVMFTAVCVEGGEAKAAVSLNGTSVGFAVCSCSHAQLTRGQQCLPQRLMVQEMESMDQASPTPHPHPPPSAAGSRPASPVGDSGCGFHRISW